MSDEDELSLVGARFRALIAEWDLSRPRAAALLGIDEAELGLDAMPRGGSHDAERRVRLLLQVRDLLENAGICVRDAPMWLRGAFTSPEFMTPLAVMSLGPAAIRELCDALRLAAVGPHLRFAAGESG